MNTKKAYGEDAGSVRLGSYSAVIRSCHTHGKFTRFIMNVPFYSFKDLGPLPHPVYRVSISVLRQLIISLFELKQLISF